MRAVWSLRRSHEYGLLVAIGLAACVQGASARADSTTTPAERPGNPQKMHEAFLERAKTGNVDLLFLGDSITQGWNNNGVWRRHYAPRNAANFGIGGDRTEHVLWRLENGEVEGIHPKVVVLMIGTNNSGENSAGEIADGIRAIVKSVRTKLPDAKILLLSVFPRGVTPADPKREKLAAVNAQIAELHDGKAVTYLDIGNRFLNNEDGSISPEIMPDYLHLSRRGYRIWADSIEPVLWSLLDEQTVKSKETAAP